MEATDSLREKVTEYELNAAAAEERGDTLAQAQFLAVAVALAEVAEALEEAA